MATHKSAMKRHRQNLVRRDRNRQVRSSARTAAKKVRSAVSAGDSETAATVLREATRIIAKAASKGVLKKGTASRQISRLTRNVNTLSVKGE